MIATLLPWKPRKEKRKLRVRYGQRFPFPSLVPFLTIKDVKPKFNDISIFDEKEHRSEGI